MHIEVERELHNLTLEAIIHGRCLAKEWLATSALPTGCVRTRILEVLDQLRERKGFYGIDDDLVEEMGNQIRRALNGFRDGIGDRAMSGDVDTIWEQDKDSHPAREPCVAMEGIPCRQASARRQTGSDPTNRLAARRPDLIG